MIDQAAIAELIQHQINDAVRSQVTTLLEDPDWVTHIEQRALQIVQNRIDQRFSNIESDQRLNQTIHDSLKSIINRGIFPDIAAYIGNERFNLAVDAGVHAAVADVVSKLSLDPAWYARVESYINQQMHTKVNRYTSQLDLDSLIKENIDSALVQYFNDNKLVRTPGIDDQAEAPELTVMEGVVVIEHELAAGNLTVHGPGEVQGPLQARELRVFNRIHTDTEAVAEFSRHISALTLENMEKEWKTRLVSEVSDIIRERGIEVGQAHIDGEPLVVGDRLSLGIRNSSIETLGVLRTLTVAGTTSLTDTVTINNNSVNIEGSLRISEQGTALTVGSIAEGIAYLGADPKQSLALGVDGKVSMQIDREGSVAIDDLRINGSRIGFANRVPGYSGLRGDIVFNSDPGPGKAFAWVCLESFQWQPIKVGS